MHSPPAAVLFDCDGVLVDSEVLTNQVLRDDLATRGLDLPLREIMALFVGGTIEGDGQKARSLGADLPDTWVAQFYEKSFAVLAAEVEAVPGVSDLMDRLISAGVKMAVGSNGPFTKMQITLGRTGLLDRLAPHMYSALDLDQPKPAPDVYLHAAAQLGVCPQDCVVIEDSASGAMAGKAAGMRCIGFAAEGKAVDLTPHCDLVVTDMRTLANALGV